VTPDPRHSPCARVGLVADAFAKGDVLFEGGAERHLLRLAEAMAAFGVQPVVYQPGRRCTETLLGATEVRSRPAGPHPWKALAHHALREGCTHLYFKYLEHVPGGFPRERVAATQHGVHWDIPYEAHGRSWYRGGVLARAYLPAWRTREIGRSFAGLRRVSAVSTMDTTFLRLVQALAPGLRGRVFTTPPFSDLPDTTTPTAPLPELIQSAISAVRSAGGSVILVPRNLSLVRGESWLPVVATAVNEACPALFVATGRFLGRLDPATRRQRLVQAPQIALENGRAPLPSIIHLGGVARDSVPELVRVADIVLIPTFAHEGASLAAAEAMALGKAVIATNVGGLNDTLDDGWTGVVVRPDPAEIARGLIELCRDPALRVRLGTQARAKAEACFTLERWRAAQAPFFQAAGWLPETP
jgi:hypothetical protein